MDSPLILLTEVTSKADGNYDTRPVYVNLIHIGTVRKYIPSGANPVQSIVTMSNGDVFHVANPAEEIARQFSDATRGK